MLTLLVNLTGYKENKNKKHTSVSPPVGIGVETGPFFFFLSFFFLVFSFSDAIEAALTFLTF